MSEIVNLRQARKAKSRAVAADRAAENRARFGVSKSERKQKAATQDLERRRLDGHRREREPSTGDV